MKSGAELIAEQRKVQVTTDGWAPTNTTEYEHGELAMVAVCYATPKPVCVVMDSQEGITSHDPWPWNSKYDKRRWVPNLVGHPVPNENLHPKEKIRNLILAGSFIAAEIDRLQSEKNPGDLAPELNILGINEWLDAHGIDKAYKKDMKQTYENIKKDLQAQRDYDLSQLGY